MKMQRVPLQSSAMLAILIIGFAPASWAAIFAYEKSATMNGEFLAPARRVSFFLWQDTFDQMRPEALALLKAAVLWAVSPPE